MSSAGGQSGDGNGGNGNGGNGGNGGEWIPYNQYQLGIYQDGILHRKPPPTTTDPNKLEAEARAAMKPRPFGYVYGGAGEGATMDANRLAFRQWKLIPRFLRPTAPRDLKVTLFGEQYDVPVFVAPIGVQSEYHPDKDTGVAAAAAELGVPFVMSTAATSSIEEVAAASGPGPRWFQLYWPMDDDITASLLARARAAGFKTLVVTLDTFTLSWRPADLDAAYLPFVEGHGNAVGFSDPVVRRKFAEKFDGETPEDNVLAASRYWLSEVFPGNAHSWEELALLRRHWDGPMVLKGILSVADARRALEHGVDGIVVSNHGGRQLDGAVASLEMLPEIVDAVGDRLAVLFDSGIRTGTDVMKALALGARAVFVGRPVMYGLGVAGAAGARHVLASLLADLDGSMNLAGFKSLAELDRTVVRKVSYGGDVKSNL